MSTTVPVVFMRHGESEWNKENRFCGWVDVDLSDVGREDARKAGQALKEDSFKFDIVFTSVLQRSFHTAELILNEIYGDDKTIWPNLEHHWKLSERHYGALTGKNKADMVKEYGLEQVQIWRRSYNVRPPPMNNDHDYYDEIVSNKIFSDVPKDDFPNTECLEDVVKRTDSFWKDVVGPQVKSDKRVLIVAHGTSLRGLIKYIRNVSDDDINEINVPNAIAFVMQINKETLRSEDGEMRFLADDETVRKATEKVKNMK